MPRNVEIKARVESLSALVPLVDEIATEGPTQISQDDTFFPCRSGRLKLREFSADSGELIFYRRSDVAGPKESFYVITRTTEPGLLRETLNYAYGVVGRVKKERTLYLVGRTRVHLDRVNGLGEFFELEVVLAEDESIETGEAVARRLLVELQISDLQLVELAYVDLLAMAKQPFS